MALPSWPPPESLPARGTSPMPLQVGTEYSGISPRVRRWWSRNFTRHKFMTPSIIATSTYWPLPVRSACLSAASSPIARCSPVPESPICAPVTNGGPSGTPVVLIAPPIACATFSYALKSAYGPLEPKPLIEPITTRGLSWWILSQGKPSRSSTPGPKFSITMSAFFSRSTNTCLPSALFMLTTIERLLQLSIVKYRLSAFGTSRNCPRVASPCGGSSLITSAPSHASSCVQVGPACTWVMSRMRIPLSASILISKNLFLFSACRIQARDATAFGPGGFIDHGIDERGLARADGFLHCLAQLGRRRGVHAHATEGLHQLFIACALDEHGGGHIRAAGRIDVRAAVDAVVVEDHHADRQVVAAEGVDFHAGEAEGAVALDRNHRQAADHRGRDGKAHADAHHAPGADVQALARLVHVDDAASEVERVGAFVDQNRVRVGLDDVAHHVQRAVKIHRRRILGQRLGHLRDVLALALGDGGEPLGRRLGPVRADAGEQRRHAGTDVAHHRGVDADVAVHLLRRDVDLDEFLAAPVLVVLAAPGLALAVREQPVQAGADQHHHVGLGQHVGAGGGSGLLVRVG